MFRFEVVVVEMTHFGWFLGGWGGGGGGYTYSILYV